VSFPESLFVYVKIPVLQEAIDPEHRLEEQLDQILQAQGVGAVVGWGGSLGEFQPDGTRPIAFTRIDIDITITDLGQAREVLRASLGALGVPVGTELHYSLDDTPWLDLCTASGWQLDQPVHH
jgi:hypothetical protein